MVGSKKFVVNANEVKFVSITREDHVVKIVAEVKFVNTIGRYQGARIVV